MVAALFDKWNTEEKLWLIIKDLPTNKKSKHKKTHKSLVLWVQQINK